MATAPAPFPTFPSVAPPPPFCFGTPPYAPYPFPYPNQPPPPSPSYHAAAYHATAYHNHHSLQLPPPYHPNPHWHQGMQQMQPPPPAPGNPWHPHHAAAQPPPPSSPPPRRPPPSSPPPLAASMAAAAPAWPFPSASVPAVQEGAAPSTSSSGRLPDSPGTTSAPAAALIVLCSGLGPERRPSSPSSARVPAPSATQARRSTPPTTNTPYASGASTGPAVLGSTTAAPLVGNTTTSPAATTSPTTTPSAEARVPAEASISKNMPRAILALNRRLDEQQARDRSSFDSLQGELAKLMSMATQLAVSISKQTTSAIPCSSPLGVAATASGAPKVFDNMPTPSAGYENCFAHPNQRSCVHGVRTNLREQNLDYSLQQAAPETVFDVYDDKSDACSNEFIPMFTDTPEQVTVEKEKSESHQASECFSKPTFSPQRPTASTVGVFCLTNEQNTDNEPCGNHVKPQQIDNQQLNMLMTEAERKEWDPGTVKTIRFSSTPELLAKSFHKASENPSSEQLKCFSKETEYTSACLYIISDVGEFSLELQQQDDQRACNCPVLKASNSCVTRFSQFSIVPNVIELRLLWDPGDTKFHDLFINVAAATKLQCTDAYKSAMVKVLVVQFSARKASISGPTIMRSYTFGLTWTEVSVSVLFVLAVQCSTGRSVAKPFLFPSNDGNSRTNHSFPKLLMHSLCTTGVVQLPIQSHALEFCLIDMMSQNGSEFRNGQLIGMLQSPTINSSELLKHMVNVWWQWDPGIAVSSYMYIWPEMRAVKTLTGLQSPLFSDLHYQLQRNKTFYIWDLGILSLIDMMFGSTAVPNLFPTGLHIHRIPLPDCSALLPPTQIRTTVSSNVEVDELTSPCVVFHLQQSTKWNSTSSNGIKSSEYAYTMDLIIDRWKFIHEQGVEKNYKAKNLLSSPNYLQILEMDILFITFLPP